MSTRVNHSALVSSMDTSDFLGPLLTHHHHVHDDERLNGTPDKLANNNPINTTTTTESSSKNSTGLRILYRTSYGLMFYSSIVILIISLLSASKGEDCTPLFHGHAIKDSSRGLDEFQTFRVREIRVLEGTSFNLTCELPKTYNFKWRLNNSPDLLSNNKYFKMAKLSSVLQAKEKNILYVKDIHRNYSGEYTCIVSGCITSNQSHHGLRVHVLFAEKPKITHNGYYSPEVQVKLGNDIKLICESNSTNVDIIWQRQLKNGTWENMKEYCENKIKPSTCDVELKPPKTIGNTKILSLSINKLTEEDYGEYSCGIPISNSGSFERMSEFLESVTLRAPENWETTSFRRRRSASSVAKARTRHEGINHGHKVVGSDDIVKVSKKFDKGTNSTIVEEGEEAVLWCHLQRGAGENDFRNNKFQVAWRIGTPGKFKKPNYLTSKIDEYDYFENSTFTSITINSTNSTHRGWYQCVLYDSKEPCNELDSECLNKHVAASFEIQLRVKEKILPLYPFITMCVEILIISAIILIYEKSKSAAEVEESDTDGSPDQKVSDNNIEGISESTRLAKDKE